MVPAIFLAFSGLAFAVSWWFHYMHPSPTGAEPMSDQDSPSIGEAEYALETALMCHHCRQELKSVSVIRLLRIRVDFVSTLPRRGHVIICPQCRGILSAELS